jgi:hypothetical protein
MVAVLVVVVSSVANSTDVERFMDPGDVAFCQPDFLDSGLRVL